MKLSANHILCSLGLVMASLPQLALAETVSASAGTAHRYRLDAKFYHFDENSGSAHVDVRVMTFTYAGHGNAPSKTYKTRHIEGLGLSYDSYAREIQLKTAAGSTVVCANVVEKTGVFGRKFDVIEPTEQCDLSVAQVDNKFVVSIEY